MLDPALIEECIAGFDFASATDAEGTVWFQRDRHVEAVIEKASRVGMSVRMAAEALRLPYLTDSKLRLHAARIVHVVLFKSKEFQASGEFRGIHKAYRQYRLKQKENGARIMSFPVYAAQHRRNLIREAARIARESVFK